MECLTKMEYETTISKIIKIGPSSLGITIDGKLCTYMGLKKGTTVKIMIKKIKVKKEEKQKC